MKRLEFAKAANLGQLRDELVSALPSSSAPAAVEGSAALVVVTLPDDADSSAVAGVVNAHVPRSLATPPPATGAQLAALKAFWDAGSGATAVQTREALRAVIAILRHRLGNVD